MATRETIPTKRHTPMPAARIAVISLSAAIRLRPSNTPTSTAMGIVMVKVLGRVKRKISPMLASDALSRTITPRMSASGRMKRMKVNSAPPMRACEMTSLRM
jgi:hypothetical protein